MVPHSSSVTFTASPPDPTLPSPGSLISVPQHLSSCQELMEHVARKAAGAGDGTVWHLPSGPWLGRKSRACHRTGPVMQSQLQRAEVHVPLLTGP